MKQTDEQINKETNEYGKKNQQMRLDGRKVLYILKKNHELRFTSFLLEVISMAEP